MNNNTFLKKLKSKQIPAESGIFLAWVLLILTFSILSPYFFTTQNFSNILIQSAITIVIASGATIVIASGGIDLSVGSVLCLSGILMAMGIKAEIPAWVSILLGLSAGTLIGAINGFLIGVVKITPLIATLGELKRGSGDCVYHHGCQAHLWPANELQDLWDWLYRSRTVCVYSGHICGSDTFAGS